MIQIMIKVKLNNINFVTMQLFKYTSRDTLCPLCYRHLGYNTMHYITFILVTTTCSGFVICPNEI